MGWVNDLKTTPNNNVLDTKEAEATESIKNPTIGANTHDEDAIIIMKMDAAKKIAGFESFCLFLNSTYTLEINPNDNMMSVT
jgi:hypothetical protein